MTPPRNERPRVDDLLDLIALLGRLLVFLGELAGVLWELFVG